MNFSKLCDGVSSKAPETPLDILSNQLPVACGCFDENGNLITANKRWISLFGIENIGGFEAILHTLQPCDTSTKEYLYQNIQKAKSGGGCQFELRINTAKKGLVCLDVTLQHASPNLTIACAHDISRHKSAADIAEEKARKMEVSTKNEAEADERAMLMLDATPLSCYMVRRLDKQNGAVSFEAIDCNNAILALFGFSTKAEAIDRFYDIFPKLSGNGDISVFDEVLNDTSAALKNGFHRFEYNHRHQNGEIIPCEVTLVRVNYRGEAVLACYLNDLREIKKAIEREHESNEINEILINSAPFIINVWDDSLNLVTTSNQAAKMFGFEDKKQYIDRFNELSPEFQPCGTPTSEKITNYLNYAFEHGYANFEWMHQTIDGEPMPSEITLVRFMRQNKYMLVAYASDLRPIKAAIQKVQESYEMTKIFLDSAPFFVEIWDSGLNLAECNQTAAKMFKLDNTEEYMKIFNDLSPEYQPCGTPSSEKILSVVDNAFKKGHFRTEWMHISPEGEPFPVDVTYVRLKRGDEDIVVGYNMDLRQINAAMAKVQESYEMAQMFIDSAPFFVEIWDDKINLIECNQTAARLFGLSDTKEYMRIFNDLSPEYQSCGTLSSEKIRTIVETAFKEGFIRTEWMHISPEGEPFPVDVTYVRLKRGNEDIVVGYNMDLRDAKLREMAEGANKAKSTFLSTMSHEIRTPMNAILGITEIQLMNPKLNPETKDAFDMIYTSGDLLLSIINDILDLSKIEAGKLDLIINKYETASFISDTVQLNMMRIGSKQIEFDLHVDDTMPSHMLGDELRIKQILNNLLSNAFKYTQEGKVTLSVSHKAGKASKDELILILSVSDTGNGMTEEQIRLLFDEYSRFNEEANRSTEGTGLGMSITQSLIQLMNGEIFVESEPEKGSTFTVHLPQGDAGIGVLGKEVTESLRQFRTTSRAQMKRVQISREPMPYGSVLVVDDVETNIFVAKGLLVPYELKVDSAASGFDAIEKIKNGNIYDIVFMDHMMPEMDGIEATKQLRKMGYDKPIVALTANAVMGQSELFMKNGFDDFISKPIDVRILNLILNKLIRDKYPQAITEAAWQKKSEKVIEINAQKQSIDPKFAGFFVRDAKKSLEALGSIMEKGGLLSNDDLRTYIIHVHGMKSALANAKNPELSAVAARLEDFGRKKKLEVIASETPGFLDALRTFAKKIMPNKDADVEMTEETKYDLLYLHEKLHVIKTSCDDYDEITLEEALIELKSKVWSKTTNELIDVISGHLLLSNFDEIVDAVDKFLADKLRIEGIKTD